MTTAAAVKTDMILTFRPEGPAPGTMAANLRQLRAELRGLLGTLYWVADAPAAPHFVQSLQHHANELAGVLPVVVIEALGPGDPFSAANGALVRARQSGHHALLADAGVVMEPNAVVEMRRVLDLDPMVGFVSPRGNGADLCQLPVLASQLSQPAAARLRQAYEGLHRQLAAYSIVPTCSMHCVLVRNLMVQELGLLDCARLLPQQQWAAYANQYGFLAVLANHAYVWQPSTVPPGPPTSAAAQPRYPAHARHVQRYRRSTTYRYEALISAALLGRTHADVPTLCIDCQHMDTTYNGTFKAIVHIVQALVRIAPRASITVLCAAAAARFHGLDHLPAPAVTLVATTDQVFDICLQIQPFSVADFTAASRRARHIFYIILDCIAWDCAALHTAELDTCWQLVASSADGLLFNSQFTQACFNFRFPQACARPQHVCGHSLVQSDYAPNGQLDVVAPTAPGGAWTRQILVFGNHYKHKYLEPTVAALAAASATDLIWALGLQHSTNPNVVALPAGQLDTPRIEGLFGVADVVVFPSLYEGFGFPVVESLARNKTVLVRDSALNRDIEGRWHGQGTIVLYATTAELVQQLQNPHLCKRRQARHARRRAASDPPAPHSWDDVATSIWHHIRTVCAADPTAALARQRLQRLDTLEAQSHLATRLDAQQAEADHLRSRVAELEEVLRLPSHRLAARAAAALNRHGLAKSLLRPWIMQLLRS